MIKRMNLIVGAVAALALMTGCGAETVEHDISSEPADAAASSEQEDAATETREESLPATQTQGTVTVDGTSYGPLEMRACDPLNDGVVERELELQGTGSHEGTSTQVDVYVQTVGGQPMNDVSWAGPEGVFGSPLDLDLTVDDAAARVYGTAILQDAMTFEDTISIEFDVEIPADTIACR